MEAGHDCKTAATRKTVRIIATSDLHGKFYPWDYALNQESTTGSVAQLATAVASHRDGNTLLVDAGDTIQDNFAEIFVGKEIHPMVEAMNAVDYDVWVTGNHDFNYGMDVVNKTISDLKAKTLVGNVRGKDGMPIADGCAVFDRNGLKIAVIGMVTPNIVRWDASNLAGCTVTDPLVEIRKAIETLRGQYDALVGVFHMGIRNEYGTPNSGVTDICNACPEFDVVVSSHEHSLIEGTRINGVLVVQNKPQAQTMSVIDLCFVSAGNRWGLVDAASSVVHINQFEPNSAILNAMSPYDEQARVDAETVIGRLEGGPLTPKNAIPGVPEALLQDTALIKNPPLQCAPKLGRVQSSELDFFL